MPAEQDRECPRQLPDRGPPETEARNGRLRTGTVENQDRLRIQAEPQNKNRDFPDYAGRPTAFVTGFQRGASCAPLQIRVVQRGKTTRRASPIQNRRAIAT